MKTTPLLSCLYRKTSGILIILATAVAANSGAATATWNGPGAGANNWSTPGNWLAGTVPNNNDDIKFFDSGSDATQGNITSVVDGGFGNSIGSLFFGNTNNFQTIQIASGQSLNITNTGGISCYMPVMDTPTTTKSIYATITGAGGTLNLSNVSANVAINQANSNNATGRAMLDMAGLDNFNGNFRRFGIGVATLPNTSTNLGGNPANQRVSGTVYLAKTNLITLQFTGNYTATSVPITNALELGVNNGNPGGVDYLYLGITNYIAADSIGVGKSKCTASMLFNPAFIASSPVAYFRGTGGATSRVTFWSIGDMADSGSSSATASGTNDFTGGTVSALVGTLSLARDRGLGNTGTAPTKGILIFSSGTIDVNTLLIGNQAFTNAFNTDGMVGEVDVNTANANLIVNTSLVLGSTFTNSPAATNSSGILNIKGGNVQAAVITVGQRSATNSLSISNGLLTLTTTAGTLARPITFVNLTNSAMSFSISGGRTNLFAGVVTTGGTTNFIDLAAISGLGTYPTQITVIKYTNAAVAGSGFNFGLRNVPSGTAGSLVDNSANGSIDLLLTAGPEAPTTRIWTGATDSKWDVASTQNWKNSIGNPSFYFDADFPLFDDSATGSTAVNLVTNVVPGSVTVSNSALTYSISGQGGIGGAGALLKLGSGTLTLATTNTYAGNTTISNGVLQLGDGSTANGIIAGNITNYASLAIANPGAQTISGTISGTGSLTKSGSGVATLTGNNTYAGATTISAGTLQLGSGSTSGAVSGTIANSGNLTFNRSDSFTLANTITGTGTFTKAGSGTLTINTPNTFGNFTNSAGISVLGDPQAPGTGSVVYTGGSVQVAPGVTITNNFVNSTSSSDSMMDCSATGTATWSGNILVTSGGQFRPSGIAGTLDLSGNGALSGSFLIVTRGNVEFIGNSTFSSSANGCAFGRNTTGNSTFVTLKDNASVSCTGTSFSLGGGQATGGRVELKVQDNAQFSSGTGNFDIHNSTASAAATTINLNGGSLAVGGFIKSQTGASQLSTNNFNGGRLKANKDNSSFLPALTGLIANVRAGGAKIDDNGFAITITQPLVHEAALGSAADGGLVKLGSGTVTLAGANTYTGSTIVSNGTLAIGASGSINATTNITVNSTGILDVTAAGLTVGALQTLAGAGTVNGTVTVNGTLTPGGATIGAMTVNNSLSLGGTTVVRVSKTGAVLTNDAVIGLSTVQFGGDLVVTDIGPDALVAGNNFQLFNVGGTGSFATISPVLTGNRAWSFNPATGTLSVISSGAPTLNFTNSGNTLQFSWTGAYKLQAQTNSLTTGLGTNWGDVVGGTSSPVNVTIDQTNPSVFFRLAPTP